MKHHKGEKINGWLIIDKPVGMGSTQVVNQTRHLFNAIKNGHTGTLDPFASGVLPIAFGEATKLIPYVTDGKKEYEFTLKFGSTTDTLDLSGQITQSGGIIPLARTNFGCTAVVSRRYNPNSSCLLRHQNQWQTRL